MSQPSIFPEFERPIVKRRAAKRQSAVPSARPVPRSGNPCERCPLNQQVKVLPTLPADMDLLCIGLAPGEQEEKQGKPFVGPSGTFLRSALVDAGFSLARVGFANLGRCRPAGDNFDSAEWAQAEKACWGYLSADLARSPETPLMLLGTGPVQRFLHDKSARVTRYRGLWIPTKEGRRAFIARHPSGILRSKDGLERLEQQFRDDMRRLATSLQARAVQAPVSAFRNPWEAREFLIWLARHPGPWAFDLEAYDAAAFPSREWVATDPCHPDWRLRGIAFAWGEALEQGAWIDCLDAEGRKEEARTLLAPVFASEAEKWTWNGSYDEEGLIYNGWVTEIFNRSGDGMLAMIALSDGRHESLALEKASVDLLGRAQAWAGFDKSRVRDVPLDEIARCAIGDASNTFALCTALHDRLAKGDYL